MLVWLASSVCTYNFTYEPSASIHKSHEMATVQVLMMQGV